VCDCSELGQNVVKLEERCTKLGADNAELEAAVDRLRTALSQMEQLKKDLQHKVTLLLVQPPPLLLVTLSHVCISPLRQAGVAE